MVGKTFIQIKPDQILLSVDGGGSIMIDKTVFAEGAGKGSVTVDDKVFLHGNDKAGLLVSDAIIAESSAQAMLALDKNKNITLDGDKVQISGSTQTSISGSHGASTVTADSSGVKVDGTQINLNS